MSSRGTTGNAFSATISQTPNSTTTVGVTPGADLGYGHDPRGIDQRGQDGQQGNGGGRSISSSPNPQVSPDGWGLAPWIPAHGCGRDDGVVGCCSVFWHRHPGCFANRDPSCFSQGNTVGCRGDQILQQRQ